MFGISRESVNDVRVRDRETTFRPNKREEDRGVVRVRSIEKCARARVNAKRQSRENRRKIRSIARIFNVDKNTPLIGKEICGMKFAGTKVLPFAK